jgi:hypothetical protein
MKRLLIALLLILIPAVGLANEGTVTIPSDKPLILKVDGRYTIIGEDRGESADYWVIARNPQGLPSDFRLTLKARTTKDGSQLLVERNSRAYTMDGTPEIKLTLNRNQPIRIEKLKGEVTIENMAGPITGRFKAGSLRLSKCSGPVNLKMDQGKFEAAEHMSNDAPFVLDMKKGAVNIELSSANPGPGLVKFGAGRMHWVLRNKAPVAFTGEVGKGFIKCNLPITRKNASYLTFTSLGGQAKWDVRLEQGLLDVTLPDY